MGEAYTRLQQHLPLEFGWRMTGNVCISTCFTVWAGFLPEGCPEHCIPSLAHWCSSPVPQIQHPELWPETSPNVPVGKIASQPRTTERGTHTYNCGAVVIQNQNVRPGEKLYSCGYKERHQSHRLPWFSGLCSLIYKTGNVQTNAQKSWD